MTSGKVAILLLCVGCFGWATTATAQIPGLGASGAGAGAGAASGLGGAASGLGGATSGLGGTAGAAATAAAGAAPKGLCAGLKACLAGCKAKVCASPLGTLINNAVTPYSTLSGGLIPQFCPTVPSDADVAALAAQGGPNGAGAVAAKVKQDEAEAKARRAAVRYLATVDCHYWPDAEVAIISALRDDRNECVRYEAALALLNGCCCNARTIEALNIVVSRSEKDGKPSETSERVRCTALAALQRCLQTYDPEPVPPPVPPEAPEAPQPLSALDPAARRVAYYYQALPRRPVVEVVADARATATRAAAALPRVPRTAAVGQRSVYHALVRANTPRSASSAPDAANRSASDHDLEGSVPEGARLVPVLASPAPTLAPVSPPAPASASAPVSTPTADAAVAPTTLLSLNAPPAPSSRGGARRSGLSAPVAAPRLAPVLLPSASALAPAPPAAASSTAVAAPTRNHRGLFGLLRDSARPAPGT